MENREKSKRIGPLTDVAGVTRELRKLYREARRGEIHTIDLSRFVAAMREIRGSLAVETFEARITALEEAAAKRAADGPTPGLGR